MPRVPERAPRGEVLGRTGERTATRAHVRSTPRACVRAPVALQWVRQGPIKRTPRLDHFGGSRFSRELRRVVLRPPPRRRSASRRALAAADAGAPPTAARPAAAPCGSCWCSRSSCSPRAAALTEELRTAAHEAAHALARDPSSLRQPVLDPVRPPGPAGRLARARGALLHDLLREPVHPKVRTPHSRRAPCLALVNSAPGVIF